MANEMRLIYANDAIKKIDEEFSTYAKYGNSVQMISNVRSAVLFAPTVDAVPVVHGRWLDGYAIHNGKKAYDSIDCSNCGDYFKIESHDREYWKNRFKNCPFCGAKMDGGDEDG